MPLAHAPTAPLPSGAALRWAGPATADVVCRQSGRGRRRRWVYAAVGDAAGRMVGAAVFDAGLFGLGTAFAFSWDGRRLHRWDPGPGRGGTVGGLTGSAAVQRAGGRVVITPDRLEVDVPADGGRLRAEVALAVAAPVTLVTPTPEGGWNATTKAAGHRGAGPVETPDASFTLEGMAWTDATDGRQDRRTTWRWAAAGGTTVHGATQVGFQTSTGMNAVGPGEDLVWWDGTPRPLVVERLEPVTPGAFDGAWVVGGGDWTLRLDPVGVRAADEGVGPIRSRYDQPLGVWTGTLPAPDGTPTPVRLAGVAEDHEARW